MFRLLKKWIASQSKPVASLAHHPLPAGTAESSVAVHSSTIHSRSAQTDAVAFHNTYHLQPSLIHQPNISHQWFYQPGVMPSLDAFRFSNYGNYPPPVRLPAVGQVGSVGHRAATFDHAARVHFSNHHPTSVSSLVLAGSANKQEQGNDLHCFIPRYLPWDNFVFDREQIQISMCRMT